MNKNRWISVIAAIGLIVMLLTYMPAVPAAAATDGSIKAGVNGVYFRETPGGTPLKDSYGNTIYLNGGQTLTIQVTSN